MAIYTPDFTKLELDYNSPKLRKNCAQVDVSCGFPLS